MKTISLIFLISLILSACAPEKTIKFEEEVEQTAIFLGRYDAVWNVLIEVITEPYKIELESNGELEKDLFNKITSALQ